MISNIILVHWNKIFTTIFMRANSLCINYKQIWSMYITLYTQTTTHTHTHRTGYTRMHITRRMIKKSNLLYEFAFVCGSCETLAYEPMKALMCLHLFSCVRFGSVLMVVSSFFFCSRLLLLSGKWEYILWVTQTHWNISARLSLSILMRFVDNFLCFGTFA